MFLILFFPLATPSRLEMMTEECCHDDPRVHRPSSWRDNMPKGLLDNDVSTINVAMGCLMIFSGSYHYVDTMNTCIKKTDKLYVTCCIINTELKGPILF